MDKLKQYVVFTVLGCLAVLAAGWFLLVSPKQSQAADLRTQAAAQVSANNQLDTQLALLRSQAKDLPKQQARLAAVSAKIPDNPALPSLIRALTAASTASGVELVSVTPGVPAPVSAAVSAPAPTGSAASPGTAGRLPAASSAAGQLAAIPLTLNVVGGYFQVEQFLSSLENLPRSMRVTNLTLAPGISPLKTAPAGAVADGRSLTSTVTGSVFMAVNRAPAAAVTVPGSAVTGTGTAPVIPVTPAKK